MWPMNSVLAHQAKWGPLYEFEKSEFHRENACFSYHKRQRVLFSFVECQISKVGLRLKGDKKTQVKRQYANWERQAAWGRIWTQLC